MIHPTDALSLIDAHCVPLPVGVAANIGGTLNARANLAVVNPTYVFEPRFLAGSSLWV